MKCPYCLSAVEAEAAVCRTCTKDLYLFKPLMQKIEALEAKLAEFPDRDTAEQRIADLEAQVEEIQTRQELEQEITVHWRTQVVQYLGIPLVILLLGHALIIMVYDLPLVYLRILSIVVPMPFAYALFSRRKRPITVWFMGTVVLAVAAVLGMSTITAVIDDVSVFPSSPTSPHGQLSSGYRRQGTRPGHGTSCDRRGRLRLVVAGMLTPPDQTKAALEQLRVRLIQVRAAA